MDDRDENKMNSEKFGQGPFFEDEDSAGSLFGLHDIPLTINRQGISILVDKHSDSLIYKRETVDETVEKVLLTDNARVLINPVEPLSKPKEITPFLHVEFKRVMMVEPRASKRVFLTFPIEIGVFITEKRDFEILDVFTLMKQKLTLYGDPRDGIICKSWASDVFSSIPSLNQFHEGVLSLKIINTTGKWLEVSQAVFNAYGMKIYYNKDLVSMKASMRIMSNKMAETDFVDSPVMDDMKNSLERYTARKLVVTSSKYVMETGI